MILRSPRGSCILAQGSALGIFGAPDCRLKACGIQKVQPPSQSKQRLAHLPVPLLPDGDKFGEAFGFGLGEVVFFR